MSTWNGKGSKSRVVAHKTFRDNWDKIFLKEQVCPDCGEVMMVKKGWSKKLCKQCSKKRQKTTMIKYLMQKKIRAEREQENNKEEI